VFPAQHIVEFAEHRVRKQDCSFLERAIESLTRKGIWYEQSADQDIRVEYDAQLCALQQGIQNLRSKSTGLGLLSHLIKHFLQGREVFGS